MRFEGLKSYYFSRTCQSFFHIIKFSFTVGAVDPSHRPSSVLYEMAIYDIQ